MPALPVWPAAMRQAGAAGVSGGPQNNSVSFNPDIGPSINRRRASSFARNYKINFSLLTTAEHDAFLTFFHTTCEDGILPFEWVHPMTGVAHRCKFKLNDNNGYSETRLKDDKFNLDFDLIVLEEITATDNGSGANLMDLDFSWSTALTGDPGTGKISVNNATLTSATVFRISKTGRNGELLGAYLATWDDSTNTIKGHLRIVTVADRSEYIEADVTSITDQSTYYDMAILTSSAAGSPDSGAPMSVSFARAGDAGVLTAREKLTANRTYYVRADGSDSNDGLTNSSGGAFLTIARGIAVATSLDTGAFNVVIDLDNGTWAENVTLKPVVGSGTITLRGDTTTPGNCIISPASGVAITAINCRQWILEGMRTATTNADHIRCREKSYIELGVWEFNTVGSGYHMLIDGQSTIEVSANYSILASATIHAYVGEQSAFICQNRTITLTGTPAWATAFLYATRLGFAYVTGNTYSGAATGARYAAIANAVIETFTAGASYLPGDSAGSTASGGQYI